jgi:predicted glycosyltransferase involved in capsule biosynthesis
MNNLKNLSDLTFLLLVRLDTIERLENTLVVTEYITTHFDTNIFVLECAPFNNGLLKRLLQENIRYEFQEDQDPILFRTKFLNLMSRSVETPYLSVWDVDVIAPVDQIIMAAETLRNGEADFVYPYEKYFLDTSPILRKLFIQERKTDLLEQNIKKMKEMYPPDPLGGAFLANIKAYKKAGLENENFYGWGLEDGERFYRWENLGFKIQKISGPLFHLSHGKGLNSTFHNPDQHQIKLKEILGVMRKKNSELIDIENENNSS